MVKVAFIGFGSIAKTTHLRPYLSLQEKGLVKLVAAADVDPNSFTAAAEMNIGSSDEKLGDAVHTYADWKEMLAKEDVDMVDICVPTYLHAPIAIEVLNMGYHVLCEKPMSLSYDLCCQMVEAAKKSGKKFMIGQCVRFGANYRYLKKLIEEGTYGKVKGGYFRRMSAPPTWGWQNWYMDYDKSHGCIADLHVHDIDVCRYLFGEPKAVACNTQDIGCYCGRDIAHTTLHYDDYTMFVLGDWSQEGMGFTADYRVAFEKATVALTDFKLMVYPRGGQAFDPEVPGDNFYYNEIEAFVNSIENDTTVECNPPEGTANTIKLIETMIESADKGGVVVPFEA